jgi:hypothetical protein
MQTTSQRLAAAEQNVKATFRLADSKATIARPIPQSTPRTPGELVASAIKAEQNRVTVLDAVADIRALLHKAVADAERTLADIRRDAAEAEQLADYIEAKSDSLPAYLPLELQTAARGVRGAGEAPVVAGTLRQAAKNAMSEVNRLGEREWLEKTRIAAKSAGARKAWMLFESVGLHRKAAAELLLVQRYAKHIGGLHERSTRRRSAANV